MGKKTSFILVTLVLIAFNAQARSLDDLVSALLSLRNSPSGLKETIVPSKETLRFRQLMGVEKAAQSGRTRYPHRLATVMAGQVTSQPLRLLVATPIFNIHGEMMGLRLSLHFERAEQKGLLAKRFSEITSTPIDAKVMEQWMVENHFGRTTQREWINIYFAKHTERQIQEIVSQVAEDIL